VTISALIADDEEAPRAQLLAVLRGVWPQLAIAAEAVTGIDAWDAFLEREPQVCFLDVRMPGLTGVEVAQRIGQRAHIVFVASHADHALAAIEAGAVEHVVKPIDTERLVQVVARLKTRLAAPDAQPPDLQPLLARLAGQVRRPDYLDLLHSGVGREAAPVPVDEVIFLESEGRCTRVVHTGGELLLRMPLKDLLGQLDPARFWQVHRSVVVNPRHIDSALRTADAGMLITLRDRSEKLPVARHFQTLFKDVLQAHP